MLDSGGDEFVALLSDTSFDLAQETVKRLHRALDTCNHEADRGYDISFCDGIVTVDFEQCHSIEDLLNHADNLMYDKKRERDAAGGMNPRPSI